MLTGDLESHSTPLHCGLAYRAVAGAFSNSGEGICWSGNAIEFRGSHPLLEGSAAEVRIEGLKGICPSWRAFIEVTDCNSQPEGGFRIKGWIKGILSDG